MAPHGDDESYHPKDAIKAGLSGMAITGGAGLLVAAFQNATSVKNVGAWGVFTRSGHIVTTLGKSQTLSPLGPPFVHPLTWLPPQLPRGVSTALPETLLPTCDRRTTTTTRPSAVAWLAPWLAWPVSLWNSTRVTGADHPCREEHAPRLWLRCRHGCAAVGRQLYRRAQG